MSARSRTKRRTTIGFRPRLLVGAATVIGLALGGAVAPIATAPASAAEITDAITDAQIVESSIQDGREAMRLNVAFTIGAGIGRGGTAQAGDTFWLDLDPRLRATNDTFNVYEVGSSTNVVATVQIVGGSRATFTLTSYVNDRTFTDGGAFWGVSFRSNTTPAGPYDLEFQSADDTFPDRVTVRTTYVPSTNPGVNPPFINGLWIASSNQQRGTWKTTLPDNASTLVYESFGWTSGPEWEFDCVRTLANINAYRSYFSPVVEVSIQCRTDYLRWELSNIPDYTSTGSHPVLQVDFDVTDASTAGDLVFRISSTYTINGGAPRPLTGEIRQTRGGQALGPTTPDAPTWVQSACVAGTATDPSISLPQNGGGVTYSQNIVDPQPGDTVEVIAELSTDYEWDLPLDPAWDVRSTSVAVYTIVLDDAPDCVLSPADPTVTQVTCSAGVVVDPVITLPADGSGIAYSTDPATYAAGDTVDVIATLDSTDRVWDDDLPPGWTIRSTTVAAYAVTLDDAPDCRITTVPAGPTVTQAVCVAGGAGQPDVDPAAATTAIRYTIDGQVRAGSTVDVIATLTGAEYRWISPLPTGWDETSPTTATFRVALDLPTCGGGGGSLADTGRDGTVLGLGIAAVLVLLGGLALGTVQLRRRAVRA